MSQLSDYLENALLHQVLRGQSPAQPSIIYVALYTSDPGDANGGSELADSNYQRQDAANGGSIDTGWQEDANDQLSNANPIEFPTIQDGQVTISHTALFDASTGGNMLWYGPLEDSQGNTTTKTLEIGDLLSFDVGVIKPQLD